MKIVLLQDVQNIGKKNDVKDVSDGYARNFLFPRNLAKPATDETMKILASEKRSADEKKSEEYEKVNTLVEKLKSLTLHFKVKMGKGGRAFGSVTPLKISKELEKHGIKVDKDSVELKESIKTAGEHRVKIKLPGITGEVKVGVEAE